MKHKKTILLLAGNALFLLLIGLCLLRVGSDDSLLRSQQAARAWTGQSEERYAQLSLFFPVNAPAATEDLGVFERSIEKKLIDAGIEPRTAEEGQHWTSAWSAQTSLTVEGDRNSAEARVIGVGGDFFFFHPYPLASGGYLKPDDLMKDRVVLDYDLAWKLFGGASLEGMTVEIAGKPYYIAGVVHREEDKFSEKADSGEPVLYMDFSSLAALREGLGVSSYEIVMPDPIRGFASAFLEESFESSGGQVVENSGRYQFTRIMKLFTSFGERAIADTGVAYPYWENAARVSEDYIARLYLIIALLLVFPLICLIFLLVRLMKALRIRLKSLGFLLYDAWDDRYGRREARKLKKQKRLAEGKTEKAKPRKKRGLPKRKKAPAAPPPQSPIEGIQKEIALDVDSIVREILQENKTEE